MAFTTRLAIITPSMGSPLSNDTLLLKAGTSLSGTVLQTTSITSITPTIRAGYVRVKLYNGGGTSPTLAALQIDFTDGTTTETVAVMNPAVAVPLSTTAFFDVVVPFLLEIGATQINVKTTLGGTSPTASMDYEVAPTTGNS